MTARAPLDFYAPVKDYRELTRQRLDAQRAAMFSWRPDYATTAFDARTGERRVRREVHRLTTAAAPPREHVVPNSQRAVCVWQAEQDALRRSGKRSHWLHAAATTTTTAVAAAATRHARTTSSSTASALRWRPTRTPYFHDRITLCSPPTGDDVLSFAVTHNTGEALQTAAAAAAASTPSSAAGPADKRTASAWAGGGDGGDDDDQDEAAAASENSGADRAARDGGGGGGDDAWMGKLGASVAMKRHALQLATMLQRDLLAQQPPPQQPSSSSLRGDGKRAVAFAQTMPERPLMRLQPLRTCELAYTLRPEYTAKKQQQRARERCGKNNNSRSSRGSGTRTHATLPALAGHAAADAATTTAMDDDEDDDDDEDEDEDDAQTTPHRLPAEAKSMRVYAIRLRRRVADCDVSMVRRSEPLRRGQLVGLPRDWRTPMSAP